MTMKLSKYSQGMTLIEVLIASIILFIAVSAMSYVSRATTLHDMRLNKHINRAMLAEYILDEVAYKFQYENVSSGNYVINGTDYKWKVTILDEKAPVRSVSEGQQSQNDPKSGKVILYEISVTKPEQGDIILSVKDVYWQS